MRMDSEEFKAQMEKFALEFEEGRKTRGPPSHQDRLKFALDLIREAMQPTNFIDCVLEKFAQWMDWNQARLLVDEAFHRHEVERGSTVERLRAEARHRYEQIISSTNDPNVKIRAQSRIDKLYGLESRIEIKTESEIRANINQKIEVTFSEDWSEEGMLGSIARE